MGAHLAQQSVLDDGDAVGVVRRVEPVCNRDHRAPVEHRGERPLQVPRRAGVEQRGRLVEDERVRVGEYEASKSKLLGLRRRQRHAAGTNRRLEPAGEGMRRDWPATMRRAPTSTG